MGEGLGTRKQPDVRAASRRSAVWEEGVCSSESLMAQLGRRSAAVKREEGNRFLGTRTERENQLAGATYIRYSLLGLSSSGIQLMLQALALVKVFLRP